MKDSQDNVERLVSRFLDDECSPEERRQLQEFLKRDRGVEDMLDDYTALDREINVALKKALGRPTVRVRRARSLSARVSRTIGVAAAACLAGLAWLSPEQPAPHASQAGSVRQPSWFAEPSPEVGDLFSNDATRFNRPVVRMDQSDRNWIVVPGDQPGEFMVVEVKRMKTRHIPIQDDF